MEGESLFLLTDISVSPHSFFVTFRIDEARFLCYNAIEKIIPTAERILDMNIADIDANFKFQSVDAPDVVWHNALEAPISVHGVYYEQEENRYRRISAAFAETVSFGVAGLAVHTAGGKLRFSTDSDYIALKVLSPGGQLMPHITTFGQFGFGIYEDGVYIGTVSPTVDAISAHVPYAFEGKVTTRRKAGDEGRRMREYTVYFPLYSGVNEVFVGIQKSASLASAPFAFGEKKVLFYGSSITQGGCASHPGNDFVNMLSRKCGVDIVNLGFSGNAKAEDTMIEYLAAQDPAVFVLDYDHNAPTPEHLNATHEKLFSAFRKAHPETPVIFISLPDFENRPHAHYRRDIIRRTYENALRAGDKKVRFIDGETLFGTEGRDACTVDLCHPNDLGFYRMASVIYPVLKECLFL